MVVAAVIVVPLRASAPRAESADAVLARLATADVSPPRDGTARVPDEVDDPVAGAPPEVVRITDGGQLFVPLAKIEIPKTGLTAPVYNGVQSGILELGVGQWPGTAENRLVLSGHRTTYGAPFRDLDLLAERDQVLFTRGGGEPVSYEVFETRIVPEAEFVDYVLSDPPEPADHVITMFACHPKGSRTHRVVVRARATDPVQATPVSNTFGNL